MMIGETSITPARIAGDGESGGQQAARPVACLLHPVVDFLCLGGGSLIVLAFLVAMPLSRELQVAVAAAALLLANVLNHPHFAHSYQIFYRNFGRKLVGLEYGPILRLRYFVAGILVPCALALFFAVSIAQEDSRMLGLGGNLMLFLVGWHYVKQGYGMIIVDSVLKRRFFSQREKRALLVNAYACWLLYWLLANWLVTEYKLLGLAYYSFTIPTPLVYAVGAVTAATTAVVLFIVARKVIAEGTKAPINGVVAYLVTLYVWVLYGRLDPLLLIIFPAFHSLQYLAVVWRYQLNYEASRPDGAEKPTLPVLARFVPSKALVHFAVFVILGLVLGYIGFWGAPELASRVVTFDDELFGSTLYLFVFWIFINVHHYFLDNVMWRRENPETGQYLFAHS